MSAATPVAAAFSPDQVMVLYRLGKLVRASLNLHATLAAMADAACTLTQVELSAILLLDGKDELVFCVGRGSAQLAPGERVPASAGIAGRAARAAAQPERAAL